MVVDRVGLYLEYRVYPGDNNDARLEVAKQPWNENELSSSASTSTPNNDSNSPVVYYENDKKTPLDV